MTKKTRKEIKLLAGDCCICKKSKSIKVSDITIAAKVLQDFFKGVPKAAKNLGKKIFNNPSGALELAADFLSAVATRNPKAIASTAPSGIKVIHQGPGVHLGKVTN